MSNDNKIWKTDISGKMFVVSPETVRLDILMKNDVILQYFQEKGYATSWNQNAMQLHPEILMYDYAGEIGEEAFLALVRKYIQLKDFKIEHLEGLDYELADFVIKDNNDKIKLAFDVKNMNPNADHFDRMGDMPIIEKIQLKEKRLGCSVILVNMVKIPKPSLNATKEILGMIDKNGMVQIDAINRIQTLINA